MTAEQWVHPTRTFLSTLRTTIVGCLLFAFTGCVLAPRGTEDERSRLTAAGLVYEAPSNERVLPPLEAQPDWPEVLRYAFLNNGELEAKYFEWRAAFERIAMQAGYPNTNVVVNFGYLFSGDQMKSWDRTMWNVGFDSMQNLSFPTKVATAGKVALDETRVAGERFIAAKFALQKSVLETYVDYALLAERIRVQRERLGLLRLASEAARARVRAGAEQMDALRSDLELRLAENELLNLEAELPQTRAMLNGILGRAPDEPLEPPNHLPAARPVSADDSALIAIAAERNPQLTSLAHQLAGRKDALSLAQQQYLPDINPYVGWTGGIEQAVGATVVFAMTIPQIRAGIRESGAMLRATEAMLRQTHADEIARLVVTLQMLRNSERQDELYRTDLLPLAELAAENVRQAYASGSGAFADMIEAQQVRLEARLAASEARAMREKSVAGLEALLGVDVETIAHDSQPDVAQSHKETRP